MNKVDRLIVAGLTASLIGCARPVAPAPISVFDSTPRPQTVEPGYNEIIAIPTLKEWREILRVQNPEAKVHVMTFKNGAIAKGVTNDIQEAPVTYVPFILLRQTVPHSSLKRNSPVFWRAEVTVVSGDSMKDIALLSNTGSKNPGSQNPLFAPIFYDQDGRRQVFIIRDQTITPTPRQVEDFEWK